MRECLSSQVLFDYLQKEMPPARLERIDIHMAHCAACREELQRLRQQIGLVRATLAQLDPAPGRPARPQPDSVQLPARPVSLIPLLRLAMASAAAVALILGALMHPGGEQSALANSITRLKVIIDVAATLNRATFMECSVLKPETRNENSYYQVRWSASGITRVDRKTTDGVQQTLWISNTTVPPDPVWQPAMEFLTPEILTMHMEGTYGLMQTGLRDSTGPDEFLLIGREHQQVIEIAVDERTFLPKTLKKYSTDSWTGEKRNCVLEVRFQWNRPIPEKLLIPRPAAGKQ
jgi:hypothetical protein